LKNHTSNPRELETTEKNKKAGKGTVSKYCRMIELGGNRAVFTQQGNFQHYYSSARETLQNSLYHIPHTPTLPQAIPQRR